MLIGPAGTGKTLTIRNLIKYWGFEYRDISKMLKRGGEIDFSEMAPSGNKNYIDQRAYPTRTKPSVCVIEDIDKFVVGQSSGANREGDAGAVSLHMLLKALDGIDTIGGVMLMATTNHPDQMTEALLARPGRFDRIIRMDPPSKENIERFLISRKLSVTDAPLSAVSEAMAGYSMAFVEELVKSAKMMYRRSEFTFEELSSILNRIHEHKKISDKYLGKKQGSIGFSM
jgi:SpoVK/Ycf46/Vps4 family AAA+-type ATPase